MRRLAVLALATCLTILATPAMATKPGTDPSLIDGHKVRICHATNSADNPWVVVTVDVAAWREDSGQGHGSHHVNPHTGQSDRLWDEQLGCEDEDPGPL
jgi:ABC-type sugar transport system substrate-binding protein